MHLTKQYTSYCYKLGLLICCAYIVVAVINAYVDPRGYFIHSSDATERFYVAPTRVEKSIRLARERYDIVAIGSSRVEVGIDPSSQFFLGKSVYNLGLSATNMYELKRVIDYLLEHQKPEALIFGLDFLMFTSRRELHPDFDASLFSENTSYIVLLIKYLSSMEVLKESAFSIGHRFESKSSSIGSRGFLDKTDAQVNHRDLFNKILSQNFFVRPDTYAGYDYSKERMQMLADVLKEIAGRGIPLKIFISPIHARQEEALVVAGLYNTYEEWKIGLVDIASELNSAGFNVRFCDFSGYTSITTEPIPEEVGETMKWYWESSHYKKELGNRIIIDLFTEGPPELAQATCALTPENIKGHLLEIRSRQVIYRQNNPFEVQEVKRIYIETANVRAKNMKKDINEKSN